MTVFLTDEMKLGLARAREKALRASSKLCVRDGDATYPILRFSEDTLVLNARCADKLRGRVEIYDGMRHIYQCLVVNGQVDGDTCIMELKWLHPVRDTPPADFVRPDFEPAGLLTV